MALLLLSYDATAKEYKNDFRIELLKFLTDEKKLTVINGYVASTIGFEVPSSRTALKDWREIISTKYQKLFFVLVEVQGIPASELNPDFIKEFNEDREKAKL